MVKGFKTKTLFFGLGLLIVFPVSVWAFSVGEVSDFRIESSYDLYNRNEIPATLIHISNESLFYIEQDWWEKQETDKKNLIKEKIYNLGVEFERKIYPEMVSTFGSLPEHPVDKSNRLTVLFHRMPSNAGGYFNSGDQYSVYQNHRSNERNMIYLNVSFIESNLLPGFVAHEFMHVITFGKKEREQRTREETWLNELRAEYVSTFLGYDDISNSNVDRRKQSFLRAPNTSIVEWTNKEGDYGTINMFAQYLVGHYGIEILSDSLSSGLVGIESINEALEKNGYKETFKDIFTDWVIASLINDCSVGEKYCYVNSKLEELRVAPSTQYLPVSYGSSFGSRNTTKNWAANWYRIIGGKGDLIFEFESEGGLEYQVPYVLCDKNSSCSVGFIDLNDEMKGSITIDSFGEKYESFIFMPILQSKNSGFNGPEREYIFNWKINSTGFSQQEREEYRQQLLQQIENLKNEIARLQLLIRQQSGIVSCSYIENNLGLGSRGTEVSCLQEFLSSQGSDIYPEQLITGNYFDLTARAVSRFQEKYSSEILEPLNLSKGTGYFGNKTREKVNNILSGR